MKSSKGPHKQDEETEVKPEPVRRLCSEIQLFDLCDLDQCKKRDGRFCTDEEMLARFERIAEEDERSPSNLRVGVEDEDIDEDGAEFDDACDDMDEDWED